MSTFWDAIIRRSQSFEKSSLRKIKVAACGETFVPARQAPCLRDPILWVCLGRLNPSSIFIHLLTSVHLQASSWGTFEILIKKSYFQNPKAQDMARATQRSTFSPHIRELPSLSITSSKKNINHTKSKCLAWAVRSYVYLTEHICA